MVIDGVFDSAAGRVVFHAATGLDAIAISPMQAQMRRQLLRVFVRRDLLPHNNAHAMGQWEHGGGFSVDASARIVAADRAGREPLLRYRARPPFALDRLRELDLDHLPYESTQQGPGGNGPQRLTPPSWSTASPPWCRRRASTATNTSARRCERLLTGNFRGDRERQELADL